MGGLLKHGIVRIPVREFFLHFFGFQVEGKGEVVNPGAELGIGHIAIFIEVIPVHEIAEVIFYLQVEAFGKLETHKHRRYKGVCTVTEPFGEFDLFVANKMFFLVMKEPFVLAPGIEIKIVVKGSQFKGERDSEGIGAPFDLVHPGHRIILAFGNQAHVTYSYAGVHAQHVGEIEVPVLAGMKETGKTENGRYLFPAVFDIRLAENEFTAGRGINRPLCASLTHKKGQEDG